MILVSFGVNLIVICIFLNKEFSFSKFFLSYFTVSTMRVHFSEYDVLLIINGLDLQDCKQCVNYGLFL